MRTPSDLEHQLRRARAGLLMRQIPSLGPRTYSSPRFFAHIAADLLHRRVSRKAAGHELPDRRPPCWSSASSRASSATRCPMTCCPARASGSPRASCIGIPGGRHLPVVLPVRRAVPRHRVRGPVLHHPRACWSPGCCWRWSARICFLMVHQKHTQMPGKGRTEGNVVGQPAFSVFRGQEPARSFFFVFGVLALMSTFAQINPVLAVRSVHAAGDLRRVAA